MNILFNRSYAGETDLLTMIDLLRTVRSPERITDFPTAVDLREVMALDNVCKNTRLWFIPGEQLVAFAFVDSFHNLRFELNQQAAILELENEIVNWGMDCVKRIYLKSGEEITLDASCHDTDLEQIALLERNGFVQQKTRSLLMARSLIDPIPMPNLPAGYQIQHSPGEHEAASIVGLHRAAFGTEFMTVEQRVKMMRMPEYDPQLDFVIIAPGPRFAAYCYCSINQEENVRSGLNVGHFDTGATHPDYQKQGLARALMLTGMQEFKLRGLDQATLGTSSENKGMQRTAVSVGFRTQSTKLWFSKPVI